MNRPMLSKIKKEDFKELLLIAQKFKKDIDVDNLYDKYINGNKNLELLLERWLKSLETNPDYSVYNDDSYLNEVFYCWKYFSRKYLCLLNNCQFKDELKSEVSSCLDMGCGIGYTTLALSELLPNAKIYGQNLKGTLQYKIMKEISKDYENIEIVNEKDFFDKIENVDLVFASEYFEHLQEPIIMLENILDNFVPTYFIFANSFTHPDSIGHFKEYYYNGEKFSGKQISKLFYKKLKEKGYKRVKTNFFNGRPCVYKLEW